MATKRGERRNSIHATLVTAGAGKKLRRDATWNTFADLAQSQNTKLHLIFKPNLHFSSMTGFEKTNVHVIEGGKGTPSPFMLVGKNGKTGKGNVPIHED